MNFTVCHTSGASDSVDFDTLQELLRWVTSQYWPVRVRSCGGGMWFELDVEDEQ